ncbi:MAG: glycosyltransferase family 39 protein [Planctomycetota bacterium]
MGAQGTGNARSGITVAIGVALAITLLRALWLIFLDPYTLAEDEAQYWDWSRHLDWAYATKGPGIAWAIGLTTLVFGDTEWGVRMVAVLASGVRSVGAVLLCVEVLRARGESRPRVPLYAVLIDQSIPALAVIAQLATIDGPLLACWTLAAWLTARAARTGSLASWISAGLAVAAGVLFKHTMLVIVPGCALAAWMLGAKRLRIGVGAFVLAGALGLVPLLVWNAANGWPQALHLLGHLGLGPDAAPKPRGADAWSPLWVLEFLGLLVLFAGPPAALVLFGLINRARHKNRFKGPRADPLLAAAAIALPLLLLYLVVSLLTRVEGNWAIAAYPALVPLAAWAADDARTRRDTPVRLATALSLLCGLGVAIGYAGLPALSKLPRVGERIPLQRLTGLREHAAAVQAELDAIGARTGADPFVISEHYGRTAQLGFYLPGRPTVYCATHQIGGPTKAYDYIEGVGLDQPGVTESLLARPAIIMGGRLEQWEPFFESIEPLGQLAGEPKRDRVAYAGLGFRGIPAREAADEQRGDHSP